MKKNLCDYPLSNLLFCGCGHKLAGSSSMKTLKDQTKLKYNYYRCLEHGNIRADIVDPAVSNIISRLYDSKDELIPDGFKRFNRSIEEYTINQEEIIKGRKRSLDELKKEEELLFNGLSLLEKYNVDLIKMKNKQLFEIRQQISKIELEYKHENINSDVMEIDGDYYLNFDSTYITYKDFGNLINSPHPKKGFECLTTEQKREVISKLFKKVIVSKTSIKFQLLNDDLITVPMSVAAGTVSIRATESEFHA